ncbi:MAG: hypothetical protein C4323_22770 [Mastigocladus sp. ERB_26_2]
MKRRIYLVIAFALSFLMMFAISLGGKTQVQAQTPAITSDSIKSENVQLQPQNTDEVFGCMVPCPGGAPGYMLGGTFYTILKLT